MAESVGAEASSTLHGLGTGAKDAAVELLDVLFEWIVPLITLIVGYMMSAAIGLSGALGTLLDSVLGTVDGIAKWLPHIASAIAALIWAAIGGAMWSVQGKAGKYGKYILRPLSTLFFGFGLGEVPGAFSGTVLNGTLGKLALEA